MRDRTGVPVPTRREARAAPRTAPRWPPPSTGARFSREMSESWGQVLSCIQRSLRRDGRRIDVLTMPLFEHQQLPETQGVVALATEMLRQNAVDEAVVEVAPLTCRR